MEMCCVEMGAPTANEAKVQMMMIEKYDYKIIWCKKNNEKVIVVYSRLEQCLF